MFWLVTWMGHQPEQAGSPSGDIEGTGLVVCAVTPVAAIVGAIIGWLVARGSPPQNPQ